jgi:hypothetical protein
MREPNPGGVPGNDVLGEEAARHALVVVADYWSMEEALLKERWIPCQR